MNNRDPKMTALLFNECINNRDLDGLVSLMTDDHKLILNGEVGATGKASNMESWRSFFSVVSDYRNHFERVDSRGEFVFVVGKSTCSNEEKLNTSALWSAKIQGDRVSVWQVYEDNPENRRKLLLD